jgi:hypothetical protein
MNDFYPFDSAFSSINERVEGGRTSHNELVRLLSVYAWLKTLLKNGLMNDQLFPEACKHLK